jgi:hypothetical protein
MEPLEDWIFKDQIQILRHIIGQDPEAYCTAGIDCVVCPFFSNSAGLCQHGFISITPDDRKIRYKISQLLYDKWEKKEIATSKQLMEEVELLIFEKDLIKL